MKQWFQAALVASVVAFAAAPALSQDYPNKPIRLIVPYAAGSGVDFMARAMQAKIEEQLGQPLVIENVAAAGGIVGTHTAAQAAPDGYTILFNGTGPLLINPALGREIPYDPLESFEYINMSTTQPAVIAMSPSVPAKDLKEFIEVAKANPGVYTYSSGGIGSPTHLVGELMELLYGLDMLHVPYEGSPAAIQGVVAGEVHFNAGPTTAVMPPAQDGSVLLFAHTLPERLNALPDVPTTAELGMPELVVPLWFGYLAPKGTPAEVIEKFGAAVSTALQDPEVIAALDGAGMLVLNGDSATFAETHRADMEKWKAYVAEMNLDLE